MPCVVMRPKSIAGDVWSFFYPVKGLAFYGTSCCNPEMQGLQATFLGMDGMGRLPTLTKNYEYQRVYGRGKYASSRTLVVYVLPNRTGARRVGITTSRKVGKSVVRNRLRRLIRENIRVLYSSLPVGRDIVIVARKPDNAATCASIGAELRSVFGRLGLMDPKVPAEGTRARTPEPPEGCQD